MSRDDLEAPIAVAKVPRDTAAQIGFPDVEDAPDSAVDRRRPEGGGFRGDLVEVTALIGNGAVQDPAGVRRHSACVRVRALAARIDDVHALVGRTWPDGARCRVDVDGDWPSEAAQELWLRIDEETRARLLVTGI